MLMNARFDEILHEKIGWKLSSESITCECKKWSDTDIRFHTKTREIVLFISATGSPIFVSCQMTRDQKRKKTKQAETVCRENIFSDHLPECDSGHLPNHINQSLSWIHLKYQPIDLLTSAL